MRPVFHWSVGSRALELGKRTLIMGVVNVTPDSFSDGGAFLDRDKAVEHAERLIEEGADIVGVGGESTRPGARVEPTEPQQAERKPPNGTLKVAAAPVDTQEELRRVIPVISELKNRHPSAFVSIDTYK